MYSALVTLAVQTSFKALVVQWEKAPRFLEDIHLHTRVIVSLLSDCPPAALVEAR